MIHMLRDVMGRVDSVQEQMGKVSRELEILRKKILKEMPEALRGEETV